MDKPIVVVFDLLPDDLPLLQRLRRTPGDNASAREITALRSSTDELADELASLRIALDARKIEILDMAETDLAWREIADAAWPAEEDSDGR
jgi:hypothetical protein